MSHHEIPSAFLIRALARHPSEHCDRCGHRMFVKGQSGLCPSCFSNRPARPLEHAAAPSAAAPFAPRLEGGQQGWQRLPIGRRFRELIQRPRRPARPEGVLALSAHAEGPQLRTS